MKVALWVIALALWVQVGWTIALDLKGMGAPSVVPDVEHCLGKCLGQKQV